MTELENVIKGLECCITDGLDCPNDCPYVGDCNRKQLHTDALAFLKLLEPMKPIRYQEGRWFKTWRCGACGSTLVFRNGEDKPNCCTDCGRPVKWE